MRTPGVLFLLFTTHKAACVIVLVVSVCKTITFESLDVGGFAHATYLHGLRVEFVDEGHRVKFKVTGAKKVENSYFHSVKL